MARSYRHTKIFGNSCAESDKYFKTRSNRKYRHRVKMILHEKPNAELPERNQVSNIWDSRKDGKHYWHNATKKDMRK